MILERRVPGAGNRIAHDTASTERDYLDFCMSFGPLIFGHRDPLSLEVAKSSLERGWTLGTPEPYSLELVELITRHIPWVESLRLVNSGTEAVMSALRLARGVTGRPLILKFDGCYHGHADTVLMSAGSGVAHIANADSAGVSPAVAAETLVARLDDEQSVVEVFERYGGRIAAAIIEPLPANHGLLPQRDGFLKTLADLCRLNGSLLIFDEVITGFRLAFGGYAEVCGIHPDLVTYGKIIGGGFPMAAYGGRANSEPIRSRGAIPPGTADAYPELFHHLRQQGIFLPPSPFEVSFLSTAHDETHIEHFTATLALDANFSTEGFAVEP